MKEAKKALYQNAVIPELVKIRDEINRWLCPQYGDKYKFDFDFTCIPELQEESDKVVEQLSKAWWITPNEKRAVMNYGEDEENEALDDYYIPANLLPVNAENIDIPVEESVRESVDIDVSKYLKENPKKHIDDKLADRDLYTTKELAELRAIEMGGSGSHKIAGHYMPFKSHKEYVESKR
tara:strand:- start:785 stop:1324 length:540 start_codon:yes stop_codon:yes gene_type:complete